MSDQILTTTEIAVELRCSKAQVYRLLNGAVKDVPKIALHLPRPQKSCPAIVARRRKRLNEGCILSGDADSDAVARAS